VFLTWSTPDAHGQKITAYRLYRRSPAEPSQKLLELADNSYTDINVKGGVRYWYYVTAVSLAGESRPCGEIQPTDVTNEPVVDTCVPPGRQVITDTSGEAAVAALDVESLSIAEPSFGDGKEKLVFTLKMKNLDTVLPGNAWMIIWNRPQPDATADRSYVVMRATGLGTVAYKYGKISPPNLNQATDLGNADAGTSAPDGTIRITLDAAKADAVHAGQDQQVAQHCGMPVGRLRYPSRLSREPARHLLPCNRHCQGGAKRSWACCDPKEREQARPWQTDRSRATELPVEPGTTVGVLIGFGVACVGQDVDVDQGHLKPSPSRQASASA
jgi:hypothetical protein